MCPPLIRPLQYPHDIATLPRPPARNPTNGEIHRLEVRVCVAKKGLSEVVDAVAHVGRIAVHRRGGAGESRVVAAADGVLRRGDFSWGWFGRKGG